MNDVTMFLLIREEMFTASLKGRKNGSLVDPEIPQNRLIQTTKDTLYHLHKDMRSVDVSTLARLPIKQAVAIVVLLPVFERTPTVHLSIAHLWAMSRPNRFMLTRFFIVNHCYRSSEEVCYIALHDDLGE